MTTSQATTKPDAQGKRAPKAAPSYTEALARLEEIVAQIDSKDLEIDHLAALIEEAQGLIKLCNDKLTHTEAEVQKLLADPTDPAPGGQ